MTTDPYRVVVGYTANEAVADALALGARIGSADEVMHFGVRLDGAYVDPAVLFTPGALRLGARLLAP